MFTIHSFIFFCNQIKVGICCYDTSMIHRILRIPGEINKIKEDCITFLKSQLPLDYTTLLTKQINLNNDKVLYLQ